MRLLLSGLSALRFSFGISRTRIKRLLQGILLGVGAPVGWLFLSQVMGLESCDDSFWYWLYGYMGIGTICVFAVFGFIVGRHEQRFAELSYLDSLTGLCNPRFFQIRFRQEVARCARQKNPLALIIADIDHFKRVNDTYGHQVGDEVLQAVARILQSCARDSDMVARVGGEEFAILLPDTDVAGGKVLAERMRLAVQDTPIAVQGGEIIHITSSFGVSVRTEHRNEPDFVYALADRALYVAKAEGRNRVVVMDTVSDTDAEILRKKTKGEAS